MELLLLPALLLLVYALSRFAAWAHRRSLARRERQLAALVVVADKLPPLQKPPPRTVLVEGCVVISVDYLSRFIAGLRNLVGGRVHTYERLLERGRREALLRMKAAAEAQGAWAVFNLKQESVGIFQGRGALIGSMAFHAYGTALIPRAGQRAPKSEG